MSRTKLTTQTATLSEKTICQCGEEIAVTAHEVLHFDSIECPACGTDTYHEEWLYEEALTIAEEINNA